MIVGIHHTGLVVPDLSAATAYYGAAFNLRPVLQYETSSNREADARKLFGDIGTIKVAMLAGENGFLELFECTDQAPSPYQEKPVNEQGITHVCIQVGDMDSIFEPAVAAGARPIADPLDLGTGNLYCYARDPFGNITELEALPIADKSWAPWLAHVSFSTPDIGPMADFYGCLLGAEPRARIQLSNNPKGDALTGLRDVAVKGAWIMTGSFQIELWSYEHPRTTPRETPVPLSAPGWQHIAFEVENIEAEVHRLETAGHSFMTGIMGNGNALYTYLRDPDGNAVELIKFSGDASSFSLSARPNHQRVADVEARVRG